MKEALLGLALGLGSGALSVYSLWLITGFTAKASQGLRVPTIKERPSGWDPEAQDPDVVTAGQWLRAWKEEQASEGATRGATPESGGPGPATLRVFFAFLLKAPILIAIALVARSLGSDSLHWCVGGVVLVYSCAVFWAAGRTHRR